MGAVCVCRVYCVRCGVPGVSGVVCHIAVPGVVSECGVHHCWVWCTGCGVSSASVVCMIVLGVRV